MTAADPESNHGEPTSDFPHLAFFFSVSSNSWMDNPSNKIAPNTQIFVFVYTSMDIFNDSSSCEDLRLGPSRIWWHAVPETNIFEPSIYVQFLI